METHLQYCIPSASLFRGVYIYVQSWLLNGSRRLRSHLDPHAEEVK